jgi:hypothetical protein
MTTMHRVNGLIAISRRKRVIFIFKGCPKFNLNGKDYVAPNLFFVKRSNTGEDDAALRC